MKRLLFTLQNFVKIDRGTLIAGSIGLSLICLFIFLPLYSYSVSDTSNQLATTGEQTYWLAAYNWVESTPEKLYPFKRKIEGNWVRGREAYEQAVAESTGSLDLGFVAYRSMWHVIGSIILLLSAIYLRRRLLTSDKILYILLFFTFIGVALQEFYLHPSRFGQTPLKGLIDLATWITPMLGYLVYLQYKKKGT